MRLTVATTTRDRCESVVRALASVAPQLEPRDELIVVDNGSIDGTEAAVRSWIAAHCPNAKLILEPDGGASQARNTAVAASHAPVICFIDDDATVDPGWLAALRTAWEQASPEVAAIGGPIRPEWHGGVRPPWLGDHLLWIVGVLDLGWTRRRLDQERIWGANMSLRVDAIRDVGGFDLRLGPRPGVAFGRDEEEELQDRLQTHGLEIWWEPDAGVHHHVPASRLEPAYFHSFMRSQARKHVGSGDITGGRAAYHAARVTVRYLLAAMRRDDAERTDAHVYLSYWASGLRFRLRRR
jgi:glycosyltransferase involved in cell wall biosynthesis